MRWCQGRTGPLTAGCAVLRESVWESWVARSIRLKWNPWLCAHNSWESPGGSVLSFLGGRTRAAALSKSQLDLASVSALACEDSRL